MGRQFLRLVSCATTPDLQQVPVLVGPKTMGSISCLRLKAPLNEGERFFSASQSVKCPMGIPAESAEQRPEGPGTGTCNHTGERLASPAKEKCFWSGEVK